ncbi:YjfB family protein [Kosakonia oryzae]|uniref:Motility protein n=1 Tax=Kosakonia oryzae TaxID=497725 RepID=A0AA94KQH4_9ENTR|nr:YjfB family protein [Kosakonia oryzae]ANI82371.1 YjfB family protein [Kosakonia oryzae]UDJ84295.1 YjfB family protein [Kosakonia oryzae]SFC56063.1 Putative motility protein [Kosakonia oryzae]
MDPMQIASLASSLDSYQLNSEVSTLVLKKALDAQKSMASDIIQQIPQLPSNPAIGRNINTTA